MAKFKAKIERKDRGLKKIASDLRKLLVKPYVAVGILEKAGNHENTSMTVAQVASFHEFGTDKIPQRPFIRLAIENNLAAIKSIQTKIMQGIIRQKYDTSKGLKILGEFVWSKVKKRITDNGPYPDAPSLAESTLEAKTRGGKVGTTALVDTGQLLNSVQYEVRVEGDK